MQSAPLDERQLFASIRRHAPEILREWREGPAGLRGYFGDVLSTDSAAAGYVSGKFALLAGRDLGFPVRSNGAGEDIPDPGVEFKAGKTPSVSHPNRLRGACYVIWIRRLKYPSWDKVEVRYGILSSSAYRPVTKTDRHGGSVRKSDALAQLDRVIWSE